jgi:hypothetical protein
MREVPVLFADEAQRSGLSGNHWPEDPEGLTCANKAEEQIEELTKNT